MIERICAKMDIIFLCKICSKLCTKCYKTILCKIRKKWLHLNPLMTAIGQPFFGHISPAARARELFKPSTDSASLVVKIIKKTFFVFGGRFSGGDVTMRACFGNFGYLWPALDPNPFYWLKVLLKTKIRVYRALD